MSDEFRTLVSLLEEWKGVSNVWTGGQVYPRTNLSALRRVKFLFLVGAKPRSLACPDLCLVTALLLSIVVFITAVTKIHRWTHSRPPNSRICVAFSNIRVCLLWADIISFQLSAKGRSRLGGTKWDRNWSAVCVSFVFICLLHLLHRVLHRLYHEPEYYESDFLPQAAFTWYSAFCLNFGF